MVDERGAATRAASPLRATGPADDARTAVGGGAGDVLDADKTLGAASSTESPLSGLGAPPVERAAGAPSQEGVGRRDGDEEVLEQCLVAGPSTARICAPLWKVRTPLVLPKAGARSMPSIASLLPPGHPRVPRPPSCAGAQANAGRGRALALRRHTRRRRHPRRRPGPGQDAAGDLRARGARCCGARAPHPDRRPVQPPRQLARGAPPRRGPLARRA